MSVEWLNWIFGGRGHPPLVGPKNANRLVLIALANRANEDGECWPRIETIMAETQLTEKPARTALRWLDENGFIERIAGPRRTLAYRLLDQVNSTTQPEGSGQVNSTTPSGQIDHTTQVDLTTLDTPIPLPVEPPVEPTTQPVVQDDAATLFERFYARYPRRVGKPAARRAWSAAMKKRTEVNVIRVGLQAWMTYWRNAATPEHLIPHPSTWLNQERWNDTPPPIATNTSKPGALGTQGEWDLALAKYGTVDHEPPDTRELNR